ncbi:GNAT family N-acetyltransferase [Pseudoduganella lurida]|uniref:GNAT family N-acetyltransferase n=1 Tax=Pseudoduganella lurida TaxID=1036180 RepID=UPI0013154AE2|nr:GNAT family N-acetyltransferase [Pseudoduganella lurida]
MSGRSAVTVSPAVDLRLELETAFIPANSPWGVRAWRYHIVADGTRVGTISLRDGHTRVYTHLLGHIGFAVDAAHRGHGYAARAVLLLLPEVAQLRIDTAWITTTPDNAACRRTLERIGCELVEAVEIPPYYETYRRGERVKLRYRLALPGNAGG